MRVRHNAGPFLIISLLLVVSLSTHLLASQTKKAASVTKPGKPTATTKVTTQQVPSIQPGVVQTTIVADKRSIQLGETVTFHLEPRRYLDRSGYTFEFDFADGEKATKDRSITEVQHRFKTTGQLFVSVKVNSPPGIPPWEETIDPIAITVNRVALDTTPLSQEVGLPISMRARSVSKDPNLRYRFSFGDGKQTQWQASRETAHAYGAAGRYEPIVEIAFGDNGEVVDSNEPHFITVTLPSPQSLIFHAKPPRTDANKIVTLTAKFPARGRHIEYRFLFDDGQISEWTDEPETTHSYAAGTYKPTAEVRLLMDGGEYPLIQSAPQKIEIAAVQTAVVSPTAVRPVPDPRPTNPDGRDLFPIFVVVAVLILISIGLFTAYKVAKWAFRPKPTFVAFADGGAAKMVQSNAASLVSFELHLDPNLRGGRFDLITDGPSLIRREGSQS